MNAKRASQQFDGYPQQQLGQTSSHLQSFNSVACEINTPTTSPPPIIIIIIIIIIINLYWI